MAILDAQTQFCSAMALSNNTTITATNLLDLSILGKVFGTTQPCYLYLMWGATPAGTSLQIELTSTASTTDGTSTATVHWASGIIVAANYVNQGIGVASAGPPIVYLPPTLIAMPNGIFNPTLIGGATAGGPYKKNLALVFASVGDNSAGTVTAGITQVADIHAYAASGFTGPT